MYYSIFADHEETADLYTANLLVQDPGPERTDSINPLGLSITYFREERHSTKHGSTAAKREALVSGRHLAAASVFPDSA